MSVGSIVVDVSVEPVGSTVVVSVDPVEPPEDVDSVEPVGS